MGVLGRLEGRLWPRRAPSLAPTLSPSPGRLTDRTTQPCYRYLRALAREGQMNIARRKLLAALAGAAAWPLAVRAQQQGQNSENYELDRIHRKAMR